MNEDRLIDLVQSYTHLYDKKRWDFKDAKKKMKFLDINFKINGQFFR